MVLMILKFVLLLCVFPSTEPACELRKKSPLDCREITQILDYHNAARSRVALGQTKLPEAKDMWVLKWDETLARMAQEWANNCVYKHNDDLPEGVGENLAWQSSNDFAVIDYEYLSELWFYQIERYDPEGPGIQEGAEHFTQMIWADTKFIGCGAAIYQDGEDEAIYQTLMVCHYRPPGNIKDEKPFEEHEHHARCERGVESLLYPGLCVYMHIQGAPDASTKCRQKILGILHQVLTKSSYKAHDEEHSLGNYAPCIDGCESLRPKPVFTLFFILWLLS